MPRQLKKFAKGQPLLATDLNVIIEVLNSLQNISVGPGLTLTQTASGIGIGLGQTKPGSAVAPELTGTAKELGATQGTQDTDTYDKDADSVPVKFKFISDIQYDNTTHKLTIRYRTVECASIKTISAESDLVDVVTFVPHPTS